MTNEEVIDYDILSHKLANGLTILVKKKLKEGWTLHGDILYNNNEYIQAMIKTKNQKPTK